MQDPLYHLLRHLTTPVVAVTTSARGRRNGMIANSAQRASLVPSVPRVSVYVSKINLSHDLIYASGVFGLHLLRHDQWDVIRELGLRSGRDGDKLARFQLRAGSTGCPMLVDVRAALECRVVNAMDAGASTFFLGDVVQVVEGEAGPIMTSEYFRTHIPDDMRRQYEERLAEAQERLEPLTRSITHQPWPGPTVQP